MSRELYLHAFLQGRTMLISTNNRKIQWDNGSNEEIGKENGYQISAKQSQKL